MSSRVEKDFTPRGTSYEPAARRRPYASAVLLSCLLAGGCVWSRPEVSSAQQPAEPVVVTASGELAGAQAQEVIDDAVATTAYRIRARELVTAVQAAADSPLVTGNEVKLLIDGPHTYEAMFAAVAAARDHIHVETYIFDDDTTGRRFADLLVRKRSEGVDVRIIYDAIGSLTTRRDFFKRLQNDGIEVAEFRPLDPVRIWKINNRDHRKLVIVDGRVAFTGGINISDTYASGSSTRPGKSRGRDEGWRDTQVEVRGPAVKPLQSIFLATWTRLGRHLDPQESIFYPALGEQGDALVQVVASDGGDRHEYRIYDAYLAAIRNARQRIWITQAYFAPDERIREALVQAARRGVDVRVIVPGFTDSSLIFHASRSSYEPLLEGGVKLYEFRNALLHAKTAVVDGVWSTVGSCNIDPRSFAHNNELNAAIVGRNFARSMEAMFHRDLAQSVRIDAAAWKNRPRSARLKESMSNLFRYWL